MKQRPGDGENRCWLASNNQKKKTSYSIKTPLACSIIAVEFFQLRHHFFFRRLRLDHIRCDLNSLSRREEDVKCPDEVVGLRREQECTLLPENCKGVFKDRVLDMCDPPRFFLEKRKNFFRAKKLTSAGSQNTFDVCLTLMLLTSTLVSNIFYY